MQSEVTKRFLFCYEVLRQNATVKSARQFAQDLDYLPQSWNEIVQGRREVPLEVLTKAIDQYKIDPTFLFSGEGEPFFKEKMSEKARIRTVVVSEKAQEMIVFVPIPALHSYPKNIDNAQFFGSLPVFSLPDFSFQHSTHRCFEIIGDQMEPSLYEGDRVICSYLHPDRWASGMKDNHCYVVVSKSDICARRILNRLESNQNLIMVCDNNYYPPHKLAHDDILEIWLIISKISPFLHSKMYREDIIKEQVALLNDQVMEQTRLLNVLISEARNQNEEKEE